MASSKNYTEVLIGGKVFTLSGFESEDYLQKVSTYLNHKIEASTKQTPQVCNIVLNTYLEDNAVCCENYITLLFPDLDTV